MSESDQKRSTEGIILPATYDDVVARYSARMPKPEEDCGLLGGLLARLFGRGKQRTTNIIGFTLILLVLSFIVMLFR